MMNFHIVVEAVVVINSRGGNIGGHACKVLRACLTAPGQRIDHIREARRVLSPNSRSETRSSA